MAPPIPTASGSAGDGATTAAQHLKPHDRTRDPTTENDASDFIITGRISTDPAGMAAAHDRAAAVEEALALDPFWKTWQQNLSTRALDPLRAAATDLRDFAARHRAAALDPKAKVADLNIVAAAAESCAAQALTRVLGYIERASGLLEEATERTGNDHGFLDAGASAVSLRYDACFREALRRGTLALRTDRHEQMLEGATAPAVHVKANTGDKSPRMTYRTPSMLATSPIVGASLYSLPFSSSGAPSPVSSSVAAPPTFPKVDLSVLDAIGTHLPPMAVLAPPRRSAAESAAAGAIAVQHTGASATSVAFGSTTTTAATAATATNGVDLSFLGDTTAGMPKKRTGTMSRKDADRNAALAGAALHAGGGGGGSGLPAVGSGVAGAQSGDSLDDIPPPPPGAPPPLPPPLPSAMMDEQQRSAMMPPPPPPAQDTLGLMMTPAYGATQSYAGVGGSTYTSGSVRSMNQVPAPPPLPAGCANPAAGAPIVDYAGVQAAISMQDPMGSVRGGYGAAPAAVTMGYKGAAMYAGGAPQTGGGGSMRGGNPTMLGAGTMPYGSTSPQFQALSPTYGATPALQGTVSPQMQPYAQYGAPQPAAGYGYGGGQQVPSGPPMGTVRGMGLPSMSMSMGGNQGYVQQPQQQQQGGYATQPYAGAQMQMGGYGTVSGGGVQYQQQQQQQGQYGGAAPPGPQSYGSYQQQSPPPAGMAMPQQQQQQQQMYGGPGMGNAPFQQQQGMGPVGTAPPQRPLARVLYPYAATEADEMDLMANEVIEILVMDEGGGWARGITMDRRRCGVFPRSYVHIMGP